MVKKNKGMYFKYFFVNLRHFYWHTLYKFEITFDL